jgi:hypothetical protein
MHAHMRGRPVHGTFTLVALRTPELGKRALALSYAPTSYPKLPVLLHRGSQDSRLCSTWLHIMSTTSLGPFIHEHSRRFLRALSHFPDVRLRPHSIPHSILGPPYYSALIPFKIIQEGSEASGFALHNARLPSTLLAISMYSPPSYQEGKCSKPCTVPQATKRGNAQNLARYDTMLQATH